MTSPVLVTGTGAFAARIVFDIAATAPEPVAVAIAGRNRSRLAWLRTAAAARAAMFVRPATFTAHEADLLEPDAPARLLEALKPAVIVQAASVQTSAVIAQTGDAWSRLVGEGGLSATAIFQAILTVRVAAAQSALGLDATFINCGFADVVNGLVRALGHRITSGIGNVAILSNAFAGATGAVEPGRVKVLAHYQTIGAFRRPPAERSGPRPRVWIDGEEVEDVFAFFRDVQLTPEPAIEISGASGVPLILALKAGRDWQGHVPGPNGLPGGYPVRLAGGALALDLPPGLGQEEAIGWNAAFEERGGLVVDPDGRARYTGILREKLREHAPDLAEGFSAADLEEVHGAMVALRTRLQAMAA
jgi:hypothetical protein